MLTLVTRTLCSDGTKIFLSFILSRLLINWQIIELTKSVNEFVFFVLAPKKL